MINQAELAHKINVSITNLSQIEQGKRVPSDEQLEQIAFVFGIKLEELKGSIKEDEHG
ncbi:helix-turn-helix transcriptional regulator [Psychrobacillus sp.]|uniref:helix-turn-helix domain-containing protein n=1 Tax=Psychrobacillus sp. TaxID=1871623 RepID=UPI0028BD9C62|nr:helix-turn-helix transcriptional regulator [Psychrobacillus sp.]